MPSLVLWHIAHLQFQPPNLHPIITHSNGLLQCDNYTIQAFWIEDFAQSAAVDFSESVGWVGMVANTADMEQTEFVDCMIIANVLIWLYWGNKSKPPHKYHAHLHKYLPLANELNSLH